jgi:hypothetical protein
VSYYAKVTPLGRASFVVRIEGSPSWRVNEVGGWQDATATCYIPPARRLWIQGALCELPGPHGMMHVGSVRTYNGDTLTIEGIHATAMNGEPMLGRFCVTDYGAWGESGLIGTNTDIGRQVSGIEGGPDDALTAVWDAGKAYPANAPTRWKFDAGETQDQWISFNFTQPSGHHIVVYPLLEGDYAGGELPRGSAVYSSAATSGTVTALHVGSCRGILIHIYRASAIAASNTNIYTAAIYGISVYAGGVAPRYDASDGLTALRAADVASHLLSLDPAWTTSGADVSEDLTVVEPFDESGNAGDLMAALLNISDAAYWRECRGPSMPWSVYRSRASIKVIDLPPEDGNRCICNIAPADITGMASALKVFWTDNWGVRRAYTAYDTDPSHYLVQIGRYQGGAYGPKWGAELDIGEATLGMAQTAAATYFAYTASGHSGPSPWTGTIELTDVKPFPAYFPPGAIIRCATFEYGVVVARVRDSDHDDVTHTTLTVDNTATATDMVARAVEGLNRSRAFTAGRAIKTKVSANAKVKKAISKKVAAARKKAAAAKKKAKK